jgi:hypothetical protein
MRKSADMLSLMFFYLFLLYLRTPGGVYMTKHRGRDQQDVTEMLDGRDVLNIFTDLEQ